MSNIKLVEASSQEKEFYSLLNRLKSESTWQSSLYSESAIAYYKQRSEDSQWTSKNLSYILSIDNEPFFAFIGILSTKDKNKKITSYELPSIFIESNNISRSCKKAIQSHIDSQLLKYGCKISAIDFMHNERLNHGTEHLIQRRSCSVEVSYTRMIDLKQGEKAIKAGLRKSYSSLINWGKREMDIRLYTRENMNWTVMEEFKALHIQESGRQTRSDLTWILQYESIIKGEAFCITAKYRNALVSAGYFALASGHCFYGVSASKRTLFDKPLFHAIMWEAIVYAAQAGAVTFETGVDYPLHAQRSGLITDKEIQIAKFKSGFGGRLKPLINLST